MLAALLVALLASGAIIAIGTRFLLAPRAAMLGYGLAPDSVRALTEIKGIRDITSGVIMFAVWAAAGRTALGWVIMAVSITPIADAMIVRSNGGRLATALGIHGITAALLLAAGFVLVVVQ